MNTPTDKTIVFTFGSHPTKDPKLRWRAEVTFPPAAGAETMLAIRLLDGEDAPIDDAVFEFAGQRLPVAAGYAELTYGDFIKGKHEQPLWLHRKTGYPVPGGMTFG